MDNMTDADLATYNQANLLRTVFENGKLIVDESLSQIRERLKKA